MQCSSVGGARGQLVRPDLIIHSAANFRNKMLLVVLFLLKPTDNTEAD